MSECGNNLDDFEAIWYKDLLSNENSSKIPNDLPVVFTNTSVVLKYFDVNTSRGIRLSSTQHMELLEIVEEPQNSN